MSCGFFWHIHGKLAYNMCYLFLTLHIISNMINLEQTIYLLLTVFIPLKFTYIQIRRDDSEAKKMWAVYWAFYFLFKSLQWNIELFQYRFLDFIFVLLALWIYNGSYKGGLFLADFFKEKMEKTPAVSNVINMISQKASVVPLFEKTETKKTEEQVVKPKTQ